MVEGFECHAKECELYPAQGGSEGWTLRRTRMKPVASQRKEGEGLERLF
jgi:hypothetical protein